MPTHHEHHHDPYLEVRLSPKKAFDAAGTIAYFAFEDEAAGKMAFTDPQAQMLVGSSIAAAGFSGKKDQQHSVMLPSGKKLIFFGMGKREQATINTLRLGVAKAVKAANALQSPDLALASVSTSSFKGNSTSALISAAAEAGIMATYLFDIHKSERPEWKLKTLIIPDAADLQDYTRALQIGTIMGRQNLKARALTNTPGKVATPSHMAAIAKEIAKRIKATYTQFTKKDLEREGMHAILAVCEGSIHEPIMCVLEYGKEYAKAGKTYALVGKGVCFDSGGLDIKNAAGMETMKMDKAGAIAMILTLEAVADLRLPVHLYAIAPFVENLVSATSYKPGDIITTKSGTTIEVLNTDAEGRVILSDALHYAFTLKPDAIIDAATLTGAVIVALGNDVAGMMGNNKDLMRKIEAAGEQTYERVWELPMFEEFGELIVSDHADIKNVVTNGPGGPAGTIVGAKFLEKFVHDTPWAHLDIAGSAWADKTAGYYSKGSTGSGVRLLTQFLINESKR